MPSPSRIPGITNGGLDHCPGRLLEFCAPVLADTWVLQTCNGFGGTPQGVRIPLPDIPSPREFAAGVYDPASNRMIVFSGWLVDTSNVSNDAWVLTNTQRHRQSGVEHNFLRQVLLRLHVGTATRPMIKRIIA